MTPLRGHARLFCTGARCARAESDGWQENLTMYGRKKARCLGVMVRGTVSDNAPMLGGDAGYRGKLKRRQHHVHSNQRGAGDDDAGDDDAGDDRP